MTSSRYRLVLMLLLVCSVLLGCAASALPGFDSLSSAMVVSVSADGRYVVSSHREKELVLWDIEQHRHELISDHANIYSAYFIQGRDAFLWQDLENVVRVQTVDGKVLERFEHFPTYGHVMGPKLETYLASDVDWGLYLGHGEAMLPLKDDGDSPSFVGIGKLLNLDLDAADGVALSAGRGLDGRDETPISASPPRVDGQLSSRYAGVVLWDLDTRQPRYKLPGNAAKTHATLSPDGRFAIAVDENIHHKIWSTATGEQPYQVSTLGSGIWQPSEEGLGDFVPSGVRIEFPEDFDVGHHRVMLAVHFLSDDYYAAFHTYEPYASLYQLGDPFAIKFLGLGKDPFPSVSAYSRNAAIDTAPAAHVLVTGQRSGGGINVYRFDPQAQTLERIWAPRP